MLKSWYLIEELPEFMTKTFFIAHLMIFTDARRQISENIGQKTDDRSDNSKKLSYSKKFVQLKYCNWFS